MFKRKRSANDFAEEIKAHLELEARELQRDGLSAEEAKRKARLDFGSVNAAQEGFYFRNRAVWVDNLLRDVQFAFRQFAKRPGFALTAIAVLALGIGISVAIFGFVDAALVRPLPYRNPNQLMAVSENRVDSRRWPLSYPDFVDWRNSNKSFESLDVYAGRQYLLRTPQGPEPVQGERVSASFFQTLGISPLLGHTFSPGEDRLNGPNVVVLSYGTWLLRFGARQDVVGKPVELDDNPYTVIGVLPRSFTFAPGGNAEFWVPINKLTPHENFRNFYNFRGIGRLRDGVTLQAAQVEMSGIAKRLQRLYSSSGPAQSASVVPLAEIILGDVRPILLTLMGGAGLLLLIACVNVASLVLARSESRRQEIAVRAALGGTVSRLMQQFATEGFILAGFANVGGMLIAAAIMRLLSEMIPKDMRFNMPFLEGVGLNSHTCGFAILVAMLATVLLAVTPQLRLSLQKVREGMIDGDRSTTGRAWQRFGSNLVTVEIAIAVVLLASAGLLGQSLYRLLHVSLGFEPRNLATLDVTAPGTTYKNDQAMDRLYEEVIQRVAALPGVESAGLTSLLPVECNCAIDRIRVVGKPEQGEHVDVNERHVSTDYLRTLQANFIRGRYFTPADNTSSPGVVVINRSFARRFFPQQEPLGESIANEELGRPSTWQVVGVIDDVHEGPLDASARPAEYFPLNQTHDASFTLVVRTRQNAATMLPILVSTVHRINRDLGTSDEGTLTAKIDQTQTALLHRFSAWLVGGFALLALVLAVVGLYGIVAYSVSQRTREIGIRIAIGAQRSSVYNLVMRQAGWMTLAGIAIGLACSLGPSVLMRKLLFGVQAWDPTTLGSVAILLGLCSVAASFLPARRAASVDPMKALRES
jgi:predicted permease